MNCHNGGQYLRKSVSSLINQSYKNWELIFWNNKSTDNSKSLIKKFKDKRIRYFESKKLLYLYHARNLAINKSKGEYICFLDTDDWWKKNKLKLQFDQFKKNKNLKITYSNFYQYYQKTKRKKIFYKKNLPFGKITQNLLDDYSIGILTVMIRKTIFKKYCFNKRYNIIGDFDFFLKISLKNDYARIQKPLAYYRVHANNYSKIRLRDYNLELKNWVNINKKTFLKLNYSLFRLKVSILKIKVKEFISKINPLY